MFVSGSLVNRDDNRSLRNSMRDNGNNNRTIETQTESVYVDCTYVFLFFLFFFNW